MSPPTVRNVPPTCALSCSPPDCLAVTAAPSSRSLGQSSGGPGMSWLRWWQCPRRARPSVSFSSEIRALPSQTPYSPIFFLLLWTSFCLPHPLYPQTWGNLATSRDISAGHYWGGATGRPRMLLSLHSRELFQELFQPRKAVTLRLRNSALGCGCWFKDFCFCFCFSHPSSLQNRNMICVPWFSSPSILEKRSEPFWGFSKGFIVITTWKLMG